MLPTVMELLSHNASSPDPLHQEVIYKRPLAYQKMENLIKEMQDPEHGVPVRSQKLFLTSIPAAFAGYDVIEWLMERLTIEDSESQIPVNFVAVEAIHLANLLCQHGYFFPVGDNRSLSVKDDSSLYRFQTPYYWPSQVPCLGNVDYAIWLVKRTLRNKQKHGLDDYEVEALNNLRKTLTQKWDFITMQADEQVRISKDRKKVDKLVTDSQERAFWRVLRPPPGFLSCVETPPMHTPDFHANEGVKQIRRTNLIEDLRAEVDLLRISCLRSRTKVSQALESLANQCDGYSEHDPFLVSRQPSNPWVTDDVTFWVLNAPLVDIPTERRVKKWSHSMEDLVFDPTGLREFTVYLKKEYCHENIRFWLAVRDMKFGPIAQLRSKAQQIYNEFLSPGAPCEINIDMRTMDAVQKEMNSYNPSRFTFDPAANHVYAMLLKKDCYPRFIRSENYKNLLANAIQPNQRKRFFNFSAPTKKKSSATTPMIFPVGSQTATAGVGEVLRATDEVLLITTGNKPSDFSTSYNDSEPGLSEIPYRGDLDAKHMVETVTISNNLSQGSFDDVCPWESMEKLPEKEKVSSLSTKHESTIPAVVSMHCIPVTEAVAPKLTVSTPKLDSNTLPIPTQPLPISKPADLVDLKMHSSAAVAESKLSVHFPEISSKGITVGAKLPVEIKSTTGSPPLGAQEPNSSNTRVTTEVGLTSSERSVSQGSEVQTVAEKIVTSILVSEESLNQVQRQQQQQCATQTKVAHEDACQDEKTVAELRARGSIVEICPWDHENGTQPESTTFTKTYSTLGYL